MTVAYRITMTTAATRTAIPTTVSRRARLSVVSCTNEDHLPENARRGYTTKVAGIDRSVRIVAHENEQSLGVMSDQALHQQPTATVGTLRDDDISRARGTPEKRQ
jgi:hypothetical protein